MKHNIEVINNRGERELFSYNKVFRSAKRVGASPLLAKKIASDIERNVFSGMKTSDIFREVRRQLNEEVPASALKFNLKQGMRKLGPTGFPFEKFMGRVFDKLDYKVKINQIIKGKCIKYEIDFLAEKNNIITLGECKYRNMPQDRVHTKDALVSYARYLDLDQGGYFKKEVKPLLVTNTKFTNRTVKYANCVGLNLLGWNYPKNNGLERIIDDNKLYPITVLPSLKKNLENIFVSRNIMLVQDILEQDLTSLKDIGKIVREAKVLLG